MRIKNLVFVAVLTTAILCFGGSASALTIDELQAQIASLLAQIQALQVQQGNPTPTWCHTFEIYLYKDVQGQASEVSALRMALNKEGFNTSGDASGVFGNATLSAVKSFQTKYGITQTGTVGPRTRGQLNVLYGCEEDVTPIGTPACPTGTVSICDNYNCDHTCATDRVCPADTTSFCDAYNCDNTCVTDRACPLGTVSFCDNYNCDNTCVTDRLVDSSCPTGTWWSDLSKKCITQSSCPTGTWWSALSLKCITQEVCPTGEQVNFWNNSCICNNATCCANRAGYVWNGSQCLPGSTQPSITSISPNSGNSGTVTIYGSNLKDTLATGIYVEFLKDGQVRGSLSSQSLSLQPDGLSLSFNLNSLIFDNMGGIGTYQVRVRNNNGSSNTVNFTVTSSAKPTITLNYPKDGYVWYLEDQNFEFNWSSLNFGSSAIWVYLQTNDGKDIPVSPNQGVPNTGSYILPKLIPNAGSIIQTFSPGSYRALVCGQFGDGTSTSPIYSVCSNKASITISSRSTQPTITSISPSTPIPNGSTNTQIAISGTGFIAGTEIQIALSSGTILKLTPTISESNNIARAVLPVTVTGVAGTHRVSVINANGSSNVMTLVVAPAQNNSSLTAQRLFVGQYDNTKYNLTLSDPDGLGDIIVKKANGETIWVGSPRSGITPCPSSTNTDTMTLLPSDFPLTGTVVDCKSSTVYPVQAVMPPVTTQPAMVVNRDASTPLVGTIPTNQVSPLAAFRFSSAAGTNATITALKLRLIGTAGASAVNSLQLFKGSTLLATVPVMSDGTAYFTGPSVSVPANTSTVLLVKASIAAEGLGGINGTTIGLSINSSSDVTVRDDSSGQQFNVTGSFPVSGYLMTISSLPTVTISASPSTIQVGQSAMLNWLTTNAISCTASNGWSGPKSIQGTQTVYPTTDTSYVITCYNSNGDSAAKAVWVYIDSTQPVIPPAITSITPTDPIPYGSTNTQIAIYGTGFIAGTEIQIALAGTILKLTPTISESNNIARAVLPVTVTGVAGTHRVSVTNANGSSNVMALVVAPATSQPSAQLTREQMIASISSAIAQLWAQVRALLGQ